MTEPKRSLARSAGTSPAILAHYGAAAADLIGPSDIAAIDRGEGRAVGCQFRGLYGSYPRKFRGSYLLNLAPEGPYLKQLWRQPIVITEQLISARVRPFRSHFEAAKLMSGGLYAEGMPLAHVGYVVISCQTDLGTLEFAVNRIDVGLVLHYFDRLIRRRGLLRCASPFRA